jgi:hypothetical protein
LRWVPPWSTKVCAQLGEPRHLHHVLPDVLGQHLREAGEHLGAREALFLEVHPVGVEEHRAAIAELGRRARPRTRSRVLVERDAELIGHRLQQHAVAR